MNEKQRRDRRRREKLRLYSPDEWIWVIGTALVYTTIGLALFPENAALVLGSLVTFLALVFI